MVMQDLKLGGAKQLVHEFAPLNNPMSEQAYYYLYFTDEETRIQKGEGPDQIAGGEPVL